MSSLIQQPNQPSGTGSTGGFYVNLPNGEYAPFVDAKGNILNMHGTPVSGTLPTNGQVLAFNSGSQEYVPTTVSGTGINQLTGLVTAGPGSGFQATTVHLTSEHIFMGNGSNIAVDCKVGQDLKSLGSGNFEVTGWDGNPLDSSFISFAGAGVLPFWNTTTWSTGYLNGDITIASGVSYSVTGLLGFPLNAAVGTPSTGDILYYDGTSWNVLPVGTDSQVLTLAGGLPTWA